MTPSFMDKARAAAQQAIDEAKKGIDSGQAKLDEVQAKREMDKHLQALGAAFYLEQRQGGSRDAVNAALVAVDTLVQEHGLVGFPDSGGQPSPDATPAPAPAPAPPAPGGSETQAGGSPYDAPPA